MRFFSIVNQMNTLPAVAVRALDCDGLSGEALSRYLSCVSDILHTTEFLAISRIPHHDSNILHHALAVSTLSFRICFVFGWDAHAAARGGLLHDFFLYNWRDRDDPAKPDGLHGFTHPAVALRNARALFALSALEEDIILRHMWPLTPIPPRFRESWVIMIADKIVATGEFANKFRLDFQAFALRRIRRASITA